MAQMPIQMLSGRADPFAAASPAVLSSQPRVAIPRAAYLYDPGGISGGKLRPGSIDQEQFKAYLAAARKEAVVAPPAPPAAPASAPAAHGIPSGVPTLSPAQLAALGIDVSQLSPAHTQTPSVETPETFATQAGETVERAEAGRCAGPGLAVPEPSASEVADAALAAVAESAARPPAAPEPAQQRERAPIPGARRGADGVWEFTRLPDKDEREMLYGQKWRVVESQASRELFLGPDGEFGWDDFVDLINPLQHIPFVNMAYRAITGDQIYGAARMVDVAFGPLAGASTAVDLAFRDVTGESMAHNAIAAVFGTGESDTGRRADGRRQRQHRLRPQLADATPIRRGSNK